MNSVRPSYNKRRVVIVMAILLAINLSLPTVLIRKAAAQTTHEVKITDFAFVPQNLTISLGDTIMWNNTDPVIHTLWFVFVDNRSTYLLSDPISPDTTWQYAFNDAVELQYYSFERLWITGFINVTAGAHDVAVTNVMSKPIISRGEPTWRAYINVTVLNEGDYTETFDISVFAINATNEIEIERQTVVDLDPSISTTLNFDWTTNRTWAVGNYTIKAYAWPVVGEADLIDNTLYRTEDVILKLLGDLGGPVNYVPTFFKFDRKCDGMDLALFIACYKKTSPPETWWLGDLGGPVNYVPTFFKYDGKVDGMDLALFIVCYKGLGP